MKMSKAIWRELDIATRDLESCFDVTSPVQENFGAFGIAFEKIIYFCCIGVEGLFRKTGIHHPLSSRGDLGKRP
jgi:hypothetical protein